jgi:transposase InsO family protein
MKKFSKILKEEKIQQLFSYPRCQKINGYIERYNMTLREEFVNNNEMLVGRQEEFNRMSHVYPIDTVACNYF